MRRRSAWFIAALALLLAIAQPVPLGAGAPQDAARIRPNYELASRWTASKVTNKLIFSSSVTPNWFESGDRFWYAFATSKGQRWMLVDAVKRTRAPLFDPAALAAQLTNIVRIPFDSAHLPLLNMKLAKKDTVVQFELNVPDDTKIPGLVEKAAGKKAAATTTGGTGGRGGAAGGPGAAGPPPGTRNLRFEYDLATAKVSLVHPDEVKAQEDKDKEARWPTWASVSPDEKVAVFVRGYDLYLMDAENLKKAIKDPRDPSIVEIRLTTDGEEHYAYSRYVNEEDKDRLRREQRKEEEKSDEKGKESADQKAAQKKPDPKKEPEKDTFEPRIAPAGLVWSQDSRKFSIERSDSRKVKDLWVINSLAQPRPKLETYRYSMPGENIPVEELLVFDVASRERLRVKADAFKDQRYTVPTRRVTDRERRQRQQTPNPVASPQWALSGSDSFLLIRQSRARNRLANCRGVAKTGETKGL
jgi:hypothetical protein